MNLTSYAELAVRLANTAVRSPGEHDPLGSPDACASALGDYLAGPVTRRDLAVLRYLRDEFGAIFTAAAAGNGTAAMARLNALLVQFPIQPEMSSHDDKRWHVHLASQGSTADQFAAGAVIGVALSVSIGGVGRLGVCTIASCPRVYLATGSGKHRRYCAEHAAAKANVSTLRRQHQSASNRGEGTGQDGVGPPQATPAAS